MFQLFLNCNGLCTHFLETINLWYIVVIVAVVELTVAAFVYFQVYLLQS